MSSDIRIDAALSDLLESAEPIDYLAVFMESVLAQTDSEDTIKSYRRIINNYINMESEYEVFTKQRVNQFLALYRKRGLSNNTVRYYFYVCKVFFRNMGYDFPFTRAETPVSSPKHKPIYTQDEMDKLEYHAKRHGVMRYVKLRNYAMIRTANAIGTRRIEFHQMNIEDVVFSEDVSENSDHYDEICDKDGVLVERIPVAFIRIQTGKHGEYVERELDPDTEKALKVWIKFRTKRLVRKGQSKYYGGTLGEPTPLWTYGRGGRRLSRNRLNEIFREVRQAAGINKPKAGFHASRRGRVTSYHDRGATPSEITQEMGWTSDTTVFGYIQPDQKRTKAKIRAGHTYWNRATKPQPIISEEVTKQVQPGEPVKESSGEYATNPVNASPEPELEPEIEQTPTSIVHKPPSTFLKLVWMDSIIYDNDVLMSALAFSGVEKMMLGTDHPHQITDIQNAVKRIKELNISEADKEKILGGNAEKLLKL